MDKTKTIEWAAPIRRLSNRARREAELRQQAEAARKIHQAQRRRTWLAGLVFAAAVATVAVLVHLSPEPHAPAPGAATQMPTMPAVASSPALAAVPPVTNPGYPTLAQLVAMPAEELAKVDVAVVNLRCAEGLPGAETIDMAGSLQKIDEWTARVKEQTELYADQFTAHPERYDGAVDKYQMDMLTTVLQQDKGIHYDPTMIAIQGKEGTPEDTFFNDAHHAFLHGLTEQQVGTCSSMPVLYAAIARRLGYPVRLAQAAEHLYLQWMQDDGTHFNIEATSDGGLNDHPDEYYWQWPRPVTAEQAKQFYFFQPLSARDELALFLSTRAQVLMAAGRLPSAARWQIEAENAAQHTRTEMRGVMRSFQRSMPQSQVVQINSWLQDLDEWRAARPVPSLLTSFSTPKP